MNQHLVDKCRHRASNNDYQHRFGHCFSSFTAQINTSTPNSGGLLAAIYDDACGQDSQRSGYNANNNGRFHFLVSFPGMAETFPGIPVKKTCLCGLLASAEGNHGYCKHCQRARDNSNDRCRFHFRSPFRHALSCVPSFRYFAGFPSLSQRLHQRQNRRTDQHNENTREDKQHQRK